MISKHDESEYTDRAKSLTMPALFQQGVERRPEKTAIVDLPSDRRISYRELETVVDEYAAGLERLGIGHGERVAISLQNRVEHCILFLACQEIGAIAVPFNFREKADGVRYLLGDSEPSVFVFGDAVREAVDAVYEDAPVDEFFHVGTDTPAYAELFETIREDGGTPSPADISPDDISVIQYSSGTTGNPKGIILDHLASATRVVLNSYGQQFRIDAETMLGVMPLYHTVGLHGIFCNMMALGGTYICQPTFEPERCVRIIEEYGVTALHEAPTIFKKLIETDAIEDADVDSVRVATYSGAPMDSTLLENVIEQFDPAVVSNQYGCTEAYGPLGQLNLRNEGEPTETGIGNILQRTRIVELGSVDPTAQVEPGTEGELIISMDSPTVFSSYLNKPEANENAIHDGWFFTGDVAYRTPENHTIITGRSDDMIISGGENIYPAEIEDTLASHPAVEDVGIVGTENDTWGEVPKAYVQSSTDVDVSDLDQWCTDSSSLADYKRPREYELVPEIPRNPSGKIMRYKLRDRN